MAGARKARRIRLTYTGAAGWQIEDGETTVLLDPYFSRIRYTGKPFGISTSPAVAGDTRRVHGPDDVPEPDTAVIDEHVGRADYIFVSHSHFNHCLDVPYIATRTGAVIVGSESTINIARALGVPSDRLIAVRGGEDYAFDRISVKVIPSLHSALNGKRYFQPESVPRGVRPPLRLRDYVEGGTLAYLVRFGRTEILFLGSMNYIERELDGLRPSILLLPAARPRREIHDYAGRAMRALGHPRTVLLTHWDAQAIPYGAPQDAAREEAEACAREVKRASPRTSVSIPNHFEPHEFVIRQGRAS